MRFFKDMKQLAGCQGWALIHCNEIHIDAGLQGKELEATLQHEFKHFKHFEQFQQDNQWLAYGLKEFWLELTDSKAFKKDLLLLALTAVLSVLATIVLIQK